MTRTQSSGYECRRWSLVVGRIVLVLGVCFLPAAAPAQPKSLVLKGGKLLTVSHGTIENGVLVMSEGKIAAVGDAGSVHIPADAEVIDVTGMTVYPGLIDSESYLGLTEISAESSTNDLIETSDEIMPHMHVYDAFHAESELIPVARLNGITNAIVAPQSQDTLPGQDAFIQLDGKSANEMLQVRDIALPLNFTGEQRRNESWEKRKFPQTRMGLAAQLRQAFIDAQDYSARWADYEKRKNQAGAKSDDRKGPPSPPKRDLKLEALLPYLQGKKPIVLAAQGPSDLETAVGLARQFNLKFVLNHISHSQPVLDYVASLKVPVIVGPIYEDPKDWERYDAVYSLPAQLYKRGVKIAFASYDAHAVRNLPYAAGYATAFGLPHDEALKAITLNPAEIWGVAAQLGSLDVGKTANVVVADGDPLDVKTDVKRVFIAGRPVPMTSRQTELRDRYSVK
ncbi:MAG: amidohydrolase family protein [Terriglobales bacterium]